LNNHNNISNFVTNSKRILSCYWYNTLELLAIKTKYFNKLLLNWRKPVFIKEIKMTNITKNDKILLIGCGIFPTETIIIAQETNAKITGIDNSPKAVKLARKYVKKIGLSELVKIEHADGINYELKDFNVVFVAINVYPINAVLNHLSKNLKKGSKVMCKSNKDDILFILKQEKIEKKFSVAKRLQNPRSQSFLLIKKQ